MDGEFTLRKKIEQKPGAQREERPVIATVARFIVMTPDDRIVLSADADAHAWLAGNDTSLKSVVDWTSHTQRSGRSAVWQVTLNERSVHRIEGLHLMAKDFNAEATYVLSPEANLDSPTREFLVDFVRRGLLSDRRRSWARRVEDKALLGALNAEPELPLGVDFRQVVRVFYRAGRALATELVTRRRRIGKQGFCIQRPVLIGAYGGDHVGDAAILGGILLRLNAHHGVRQAVLASFRPRHTQRFVKCLDIPVDVRVFEYEPKPLRHELAKADALIFAGGPFMELPSRLVLHWQAALEARGRRIPFVIDRIGVGPFITLPSRLIARRIVRLADSVSVRTRASGKQPELAGITCTVERDPAFEYLKTRTTLTRLRPRDREDVEALLAGTSERFLVGVNLRPLVHKWSSESPAQSKASEAHCIECIAEAIATIASRFPATFIFFPMNPIQLGDSDLRAAWHLHRRVCCRADLRVWEGDPEIDGLLYLLRRLDAVVAMRFHACIFAMSQGIPTLGIDYYPSTGGNKVGELFSDFFRGDDVVRIESIHSEWLVKRLEVLAGAKRHRG